MIMHIFAVRAPTKVTMFFLLIIQLGWISAQRLPINLIPDVRTPRITTEVRTEGSPPSS
jgi:multidrug efflux pump subunit AcrB